MSEDQLFRTQYLTRLTGSPALADMNYTDLPPFYPAGWFWLGGRFAALLEVPAWTAYKPWALTTLALVPVMAYWSWSRLISARVGLCVGLVVVATGLSGAATEPYAWVAGALLPGVLVLFWRSVAPGTRPMRVHLIGIGVFLGAALSVYTLYAGLGAIMVCALAATAAVMAGPGRRRAALTRSAVSLLVVGVTSAITALPVWAPHLLAVLRGGSGDNVAARSCPRNRPSCPADA